MYATISYIYYKGQGNKLIVNFSLMYFWLFMNIATFFLYAWDKRQAKRKAWRVSERKLLLWAFFGGAVGAFFAMFLFHQTNCQIKCNTYGKKPKSSSLGVLYFIHFLGLLFINFKL